MVYTNNRSNFKIRDASNIPDPPKANQVEIMKLNNIREFLNKIKEIKDEEENKANMEI